MSAELTKEKVTELLDQVMHPEINASLVELGIISVDKVENGQIDLIMKLPFAGVPQTIRDMMLNGVAEKLTPYEDYKINVFLTVMNEAEKQRFLELEHSKWKGGESACQ